MTSAAVQKVVSIANYANVRAMQSQGEQVAWQDYAIEQISELVNLPVNWDGYGAPAIDRQIGMFALEVLQKVMTPGMPRPSIVPSSVGGVQIEWHERTADLEIHVTAPYQGEVLFVDHVSGQQEELSLTDNADRIGHFVMRLLPPDHERANAAGY